MFMHPLFTIGHSDHLLERFLALLQQHHIGAVADVRSQPFSGRFPWFCREALGRSLRAARIGYVFLGRELGARREEPDCYLGQRVVFERVAASPAFRVGLERVKAGLQRHRIALLCAEKEPLDCHRTLLIARHAMAFADVRHILADGRLEPHAACERRLLARYPWGEGDLFCTHQATLAQAYARRGEEVAWVNPAKPCFPPGPIATPAPPWAGEAHALKKRWDGAHKAEVDGVG